MMKITYFTLLTGMLLIGCAGKSSQTDCMPQNLDLPEELRNKELKAQLNALKDSVDAYKAKCFASEDVKFNKAKALLAKLEAYPHTDKNLLEIARLEFENAQKNLYTQETFSQDEVVSLYDTYTVNYVEAISRIRSKLNGLEAIEEGEKDYTTLYNANEKDISLRFGYSRFALLYNTLLDCDKTNQEGLKPVPYFYGIKPEIKQSLQELDENEGFE